MGFLEDLELLWKTFDPKTQADIKRGLGLAAKEVARAGWKAAKERPTKGKAKPRRPRAPPPPPPDVADPADLRVLGVKATVTLADLKLAYKRRAFEVHPDRGGGPGQFEALAAAYERVRAAVEARDR